MNTKKWIVLVFLLQHLFLTAQIPYFNIQIDFPEGLPQGSSVGLIEVDSFYYLAGAYNYGCDTGLIIKLNKYDLTMDYLKVMVNPGTRVHNILKPNNADNLIITGTTYDCTQITASIDFYISRLSSPENLINFDTQIKGVSARAEIPIHAIIDQEENIVMTGWSYSPDNSVRQSILIFKADSSFNEIFYRRYPSSSPAYNYFGNDIVATPDGGYIVVGNHRLEDYTEDAALIFKIDALGNVQWWHEFMPDHGLYEENLYFTSIVQKENGEYIVIGYKTINPPLLLNYQEHWIMGFSEDGDMIWEQQFGRNHKAELFKITPSNDGNYLVCGGERDEVDFETNYFKQYGTVGKITPDGDLLWSRKYHEEQIYAYTDIFWNVIPTQDGGILCIGSTNPNDEERQNIWVMKLDSLGCAEPDCDPSVGIIELPVGDNSPVLLYPNPASGIFTVAAKDETTFIEKLIINDANGRQVFQKIDNRSTAIPVDLENAAAGMYFCRMEMGGVWYVRQVLVSW